MKRKILFVCYSLKVGGIERALVEQINYLAEKGEDVSLYLFTINGQYLKDVNNKVKIIGNMPFFKYLSLTQKEAKEKGGFVFWFRTFFAVVVKIIGFPILWKMLSPFISQIGKYDVAISYTSNISLKSLYCGCPEFVLDKVEAKQKIAWIHADYQRSNMACQYNNLLYQRFDEVVNVTECMKRKFDALKLIPEKKSKFIYNRFDANQIIQKANLHTASYHSDWMNIVTVGRLEKEKGVDQLMYVAKRMFDKGIKFCWYFVGTGVLDEWCKDFVKNNKMESSVQFLGQKSNPYPYVKNAGIFISGSLSETVGLSIIEALVLGVPTVAYKFDAIDEILNRNNGLVANSFDEMQLLVEQLLTDNSSYEQLKSRTQILLDYNNLNAIQIEQLLKR